jgi:hypothetical protein
MNMSNLYRDFVLYLHRQRECGNKPQDQFFFWEHPLLPHTVDEEMDDTVPILDPALECKAALSAKFYHLAESQNKCIICLKNICRRYVTAYNKSRFPVEHEWYVAMTMLFYCRKWMIPGRKVYKMIDIQNK